MSPDQALKFIETLAVCALCWLMTWLLRKEAREAGRVQVLRDLAGFVLDRAQTDDGKVVRFVLDFLRRPPPGEEGRK